MEDRGGRLVAVRDEVHRNLSMDSAASNYAVTAVNTASTLVRIARDTGLAFMQKGVAESAPLSSADLARLGDDARRLSVSLDGSAVHEFDIFDQGQGLTGATLATQAADLAARIEAAVAAVDPDNPAFANFTCTAAVCGSVAVLRATSGTPAADREHSSVVFGNARIRNAAVALRLGTTNGGREISGSSSARPQQNGTVWPALARDFDFTILETPASITIDLTDAAGTVVYTRTLALWTAAADRPTSLLQFRGRRDIPPHRDGAARVRPSNGRPRRRQNRDGAGRR